MFGKARFYPDDFLAIRKNALTTLSFEKVFEKFSKSAPLYSVSWTHRGTCPNPNHKGGTERTPSFYFSDKSREFNCFGCQWNGDLFTFLSVMMATPDWLLVEEVYDKKNLDLNKILAESPVLRKSDNFDVKYDLGIILRDYLISKKDSPDYIKEAKWVDSIFKRLDDRFNQIGTENVVDAQNFSNQILLELDRRNIK